MLNYILITIKRGAKMTNIEILAGSDKFKKVEDIFLNFDLVVDILRDDVIKVLGKNGIISQDFDEYFFAACKIIESNLKKKQHLGGIQRLLNCKDIEEGFKILLSKLRGYTHNQMQKNRKNSVAYFKFMYKNEVEKIDTNSDPLDLILAEEEAEIELQSQKEAKEKEIENFKKMVEKGEIKVGKTRCGNTQLCFNF